MFSLRPAPSLRDYKIIRGPLEQKRAPPRAVPHAQSAAHEDDVHVDDAAEEHRHDATLNTAVPLLDASTTTASSLASSPGEPDRPAASPHAVPAPSPSRRHGGARSTLRPLMEPPSPPASASVSGSPSASAAPSRRKPRPQSAPAARRRATAATPPRSAVPDVLDKKVQQLCTAVPSFVQHLRSLHGAHRERVAAEQQRVAQAADPDLTAFIASTTKEMSAGTAAVAPDPGAASVGRVMKDFLAGTLPRSERAARIRSRRRSSVSPGATAAALASRPSAVVWTPEHEAAFKEVSRHLKHHSDSSRLSATPVTANMRMAAYVASHGFKVIEAARTGAVTGVSSTPPPPPPPPPPPAASHPLPQADASLTEAMPHHTKSAPALPLGTASQRRRRSSRRRRLRRRRRKPDLRMDPAAAQDTHGALSSAVAAAVAPAAPTSPSSLPQTSPHTLLTSAPNTPISVHPLTSPEVSPSSARSRASPATSPARSPASDGARHRRMLQAARQRMRTVEFFDGARRHATSTTGLDDHQPPKPKVKRTDRSQHMTDGERQFAAEQLADTMLKQRSLVVSRWLDARRQYFERRAAKQRSVIHKRDAAFHRRLAIAEKQTLFRRDVARTRANLAERFEEFATAPSGAAPRPPHDRPWRNDVSGVLAGMLPVSLSSKGGAPRRPRRASLADASSKARVVAAGVSSTPAYQARKHRLMGTKLVASHAERGLSNPKVVGVTNARTASMVAQLDTLRAYQAETVGTDVARSMDWARQYADRVATVGGGSRLKGRAKTAAQQALQAREAWAAVRLQAVFRGYVGRLYAWALRYVSSPDRIAAAFRRADTNGNGRAEPEELGHLVDALGGAVVATKPHSPLSRQRSTSLRQLMAAIGTDDDGLVTLSAFTSWWLAHLPRPATVLGQLKFIQKAKGLMGYDRHEELAARTVSMFRPSPKPKSPPVGRTPTPTPSKLQALVTRALTPSPVASRPRHLTVTPAKSASPPPLASTKPSPALPSPPPVAAGAPPSAATAAAIPPGPAPPTLAVDTRAPRRKPRPASARRDRQPLITPVAADAAPATATAKSRRRPESAGGAMRKPHTPLVAVQDRDSMRTSAALDATAYLRTRRRRAGGSPGGVPDVADGIVEEAGGSEAPDAILTTPAPGRDGGGSGTSGTAAGSGVAAARRGGLSGRRQADKDVTPPLHPARLTPVLKPVRRRASLRRSGSGSSMGSGSGFGSWSSSRRVEPNPHVMSASERRKQRHSNTRATRQVQSSAAFLAALGASQQPRVDFVASLPSSAAAERERAAVARRRAAFEEEFADVANGDLFKEEMARVDAILAELQS